MVAGRDEVVSRGVVVWCKLRRRFAVSEKSVAPGKSGQMESGTGLLSLKVPRLIPKTGRH